MPQGMLQDLWTNGQWSVGVSTSTTGQRKYSPEIFNFSISRATVFDFCSDHRNTAKGANELNDPPGPLIATPQTHWDSLDWLRRKNIAFGRQSGDGKRKRIRFPRFTITSSNESNEVPKFYGYLNTFAWYMDGLEEARWPRQAYNWFGFYDVCWPISRGVANHKNHNYSHTPCVEEVSSKSLRSCFTILRNYADSLLLFYIIANGFLITRKVMPKFYHSSSESKRFFRLLLSENQILVLRLMKE